MDFLFFKFAYLRIKANPLKQLGLDKNRHIYWTNYSDFYLKLLDLNVINAKDLFQHVEISPTSPFTYLIGHINTTCLIFIIIVKTTSVLLERMKCNNFLLIINTAAFLISSVNIADILQVSVMTILNKSPQDLSILEFWSMNVP